MIQHAPLTRSEFIAEAKRQGFTLFIDHDGRRRPIDRLPVSFDHYAFKRIREHTMVNLYEDGRLAGTLGLR